MERQEGVARGVEKSSVVRGTPAAGPAVEKQRGPPLRVPAPPSIRRGHRRPEADRVRAARSAGRAHGGGAPPPRPPPATPPPPPSSPFFGGGAGFFFTSRAPRSVQASPPAEYVSVS